MKVLINMDATGCVEVITDEPAEVICVSEHTPHDRLYRLTDAHMVSPEAVAAILGQDHIGSATDDRHEAMKNRILAHMDGKPFLKPVK